MEHISESTEKKKSFFIYISTLSFWATLLSNWFPAPPTGPSSTLCPCWWGDGVASGCSGRGNLSPAKTHHHISNMPLILPLSCFWNPHGGHMCVVWEEAALRDLARLRMCGCSFFPFNFPKCLTCLSNVKGVHLLRERGGGKGAARVPHISLFGCNLRGGNVPFF